MRQKRTKEEIITAIKQSILRKRIAIAENQLSWYRQELKSTEA